MVERFRLSHGLWELKLANSHGPFARTVVSPNHDGPRRHEYEFDMDERIEALFRARNESGGWRRT